MQDKFQDDRHKSLALKILVAFSYVVISLLGLITFLVFSLPHKKDIPFSVIIALIIGTCLAITALILIRKEKYTTAKYILSVFPPYVFVIISLLLKSNGILANTFTYLIPRMLSVTYVMAPIILFGVRHSKKLIISLILLSPTVFLFDYAHNYMGVYLEELPYIHQFYYLFIGLSLFFFSIVFLSLLFFQKSNLLFRNKIDIQKIKIAQELEKVENLNKQLQFQSNLYTILDITSKNKSLKDILQEVLDQLLKMPNLTIENKGLIFLTNIDGNLEIIAHKNVGELINMCSVIKKGQCLCGEVLQKKTNLFCNSVGHNHTIKPKGMKPHGHYVVPIMQRDKIIGAINIYIKAGEEKNENIETFLNAVSRVLARKIISNTIYNELKLKNIEHKILGEKLSGTLSELSDSISYAQSLQQSLIPNQKTINSFFKESSFLYKPKDNVSGDFYFAHNIKDNLYFGIGDCTGHGIPGSFLASMSVEAVKTVILNSNNSKPDKILTQLRNIAKERFATNSLNIRSDAMDAALCMYNKTTNILYYSGGFINLWIVRGNNELIEYKATKCPVGSYPIEFDFELHEIQLEKGDLICLASDGYADQFGIDNNSENIKPTKFKRKRLKDMLVKNSSLSCVNQIQVLDKKITDWRGSYEQIDDITVFIARHE